MLKRAVTRVAVLLLLCALGPVAVAAATPPITCPPGQAPNPITGQCVIMVDTGGGGGGGGPVKCEWAGREIPCTD